MSQNPDDRKLKSYPTTEDNSQIDIKCASTTISQR